MKDIVYTGVWTAACVGILCIDIARDHDPWLIALAGFATGTWALNFGHALSRYWR